MNPPSVPSATAAATGWSWCAATGPCRAAARRCLRSCRWPWRHRQKEGTTGIGTGIYTIYIMKIHEIYWITVYWIHISSCKFPLILNFYRHIHIFREITGILTTSGVAGCTLWLRSLLTSGRKMTESRARKHQRRLMMRMTSLFRRCDSQCISQIDQKWSK